jgi:glycosyltransferase involved in cell wall biosynthesis
MRPVAIFTGAGGMRWSPRDIETRGLGGSETAVVHVARALARTGRAVTVYGNAVPATDAGVEYREAAEFEPAEWRGALLSLRRPEVFGPHCAASVRVLWTQDPSGGASLGPSLAPYVDHVLAVSQWHADRLRERHPYLADKVRAIRNGIDVALFERSPGARDPRVLFTSQPERGLDVLLELWPRVRAEVPDAELAFCHAPVYEFIAGRIDHVAEHRRLIDDLARQPGVTRLGSLSQPDLAALMLRSRVWAHPSWATPDRLPFNETSCVSAMEAQAAGMWPVASAWGALVETVRIGALIDPEGAPGEPWRSRLVEEIVRGLTDPEVQRLAAERGRPHGRTLGWEEVALAIDPLLDADAASPREADASGVSVVIAAYDAELWVESCLESLDRQTVPPLEVLVVDDGSRDRTAELARRAGVRVISTPHRGAGAARDTGAAAARGDVLVFLDSDEVYEPDFLERLAEPLRDPDVRGTFPGGLRWRNPNQGLARAWLRMRGFADGEVPERGPTNPFPKALRRADFERAGGYPHVGFGEDQAFGARTGPAVVVPDARYAFTLPWSSRQILRKSRWIGRGPRFERERPPMARLLPPASLAEAARLAREGDTRAAWVRLLYDGGRLLGFTESRLLPRRRNVA